MNIVSCSMALIGCNPQNFNLSKSAEDCVTFPCNDLYLIYNKVQKTYGVFDSVTDELTAIGYNGHGCVIFDCLYFGRDIVLMVETIYRMSN